MRRTQALAAVTSVERRLKAQAAAAQAVALEVAALRHRNRAARARNLYLFNAGAPLSAFVCAVGESHRSGLESEAVLLAARQRIVDDAARAAVAAVVPWAQIRCGLERRVARRTAVRAS